MAENEQNNEDEYLFGDPDAVNPDTSDLMSEGEQKSFELPSTTNKNNIRRNAIIAVAAIIVIVIIYNLVTSRTPYTPKKTVTNNQIIQPPAIQPSKATAPPIVVEQRVSPMVHTTNVDSARINDKLNAVESNQQTIQSEVGTLNNQMTSMNNNVNTIMMKMAELNQIITQLNAKLETQSQIIDRLTARRVAPKPPKPRVFNGFLNQKLKYYVQAVIPGRAWLIATNGATLTVREGTLISGYGVVKLIDPTQGRVLTSSGRVIRFSQSDS